MNTTVTIRKAIISPKKDGWDKSSDEARTSHVGVDITLEGNAAIYSRILAKLEELAKAEGWELI